MVVFIFYCIFVSIIFRTLEQKSKGYLALRNVIVEVELARFMRS